MKIKNGNVAVITVIIVIVAVTAGIVGWLVSGSTQAPTKIVQTATSQATTLVTQTPPSVPTTTPVQQFTTPSVTPDETTTQQTYTNTQYGFTLQIPADWKGYSTKNDNGSVSFNLPKYDGVFNIFIYTNSDWSKKRNSDEIITEDVLGTNNKYTYTFGQGMLLAGGNVPSNDDALAAQLKEVGNIKKSFKLIQ